MLPVALCALHELYHNLKAVIVAMVIFSLNNCSVMVQTDLDKVLQTYT